MAEALDSVEMRISREATNWLVLLQDDPGDRDLRRQFQAWLDAAPAHGDAWAATQRTAGLLAALPPAQADHWQPFVAAERSRPPVVVDFPARSNSHPRAIRRVLVGAVGAIAACLAVLVLPDVLVRLRADVSTATAELRTLSLPDGSTAVLAPDSAIAIAFTGAERRVTLLAGEAFFQVAHESLRPFVVAADGIETTDIGTAFDVLRTLHGAKIAVTEGSVRVDYRSAAPPVSEMLIAGQSVRVGWSGGAVRGTEPVTQIAAWRQKQLIAQDEPMASVIDQLRPYFPGKIVLADQALGARSVTGVYNLADPVDALGGIARARKAVVRQITPWLLVVSAQ